MTLSPLTRGELFWLAYLWWVNDCSERMGRAFMLDMFQRYSSPAHERLHRLALRPSPLLQRLSKR